jgi:uncharacterized protein (TIGR00369 family)
MSDWPPPGFTETKLLDPFEIFVGPVFEQGSKGGRSFVFRVDERHVNRRGVLHGGMFMTFADLTLGAAAWDATDGAPSVTLGMQTQFLKSARGGDVVAVKPELVRRTRALIFLRGDFTVAGEVVFAAASVWKLLGQD